MSVTHWREVKVAFAAAVSGAPSERTELLTRLRTEDPVLASEVEALLAADAEAADFLETPPPIPAELLARGPADLTADEHIGPYRVLRELGRGGMGGVYLAERADGQYRQRVAIKLLHPGLNAGDAADRFRAERQILASLKHPGIARLLDGGTAPDDRPYLVMEYIEGAPLVAYCEERDLPLAERISIFIDVCRAVGCAHRNLLVHRDLKASNILVTEGGQPKLLDFGIAKLLEDSELADRAPATRTGLRLMTPACASPEQVRGDPVTTASDVYQLGLLLYELLAGAPPYRVDTTSPRAVERIICESRPEPLPRSVPEDLRTIVTVSLRKEPDRRYGSADQLADDLRRFLAGHPVSARADTWRYRTSRFVRRNWRAVAAAAGAAVLLIVLAAVSLRYAVTTAEQSRLIAAERDRARAGEARAEQVTEFMVSLFESALPGSARGDTLTVRTVLERAGNRIDSALAQQPAMRATLLNAIGRIQYGLGAVEPGGEHVARALALRRDLHDGPHPDLIESLYQLANQNRLGFHFAPADTLFREALALQRALPDADPLRTSELLQGWAATLRDLGRADTAVVLMREVVALRERLQGRAHPDYLDALATLAYAIRGTGDLNEAERLYREVLDGQRALGEAGRVHLPETLSDFAFVLLQKEDYEAAERAYREATDIHADLYGPGHLTTLEHMSSVAGVLTAAGRFDEAEAVAREVLARTEEHFPGSTWQLGRAQSRLAGTILASEDFARAAESLRAAVATMAAALGPDHLWTVAAEHELGSALVLAGRTEEGRRHLDRTLPLLEREARRVSTLLHMHHLGSLIEALRMRGDTTMASRYQAFRDLKV